MKVIEINAQSRKDLNKKSAKKLISEGFVPGVLYGGKKGNATSVHFYVVAKEIRCLNYETCFVDLKIANKVYRCILQEKQVHPVSNIPIHIDFFQIFDKFPILMEIPLQLTGKAVGVEKGGLLIKKLRKIKVKALPKNMPEKITLDVSHLDLGKTSKAKEIIPGDYTILNSPLVPVAVVEIPRALRSKGTQEEKKKEEAPS